MSRYLTLAIALTLGSPLLSQDRREPDYRRPEVTRERRVELQRAEVPEELVLVVPDQLRVPERRPASREEQVDREAAEAAQWTARQVAAGYGYREYYRLGFYRAMHATVENRSYAFWDYQEGLRAGRRDRTTRASAESLALETATSIASERAAEDVAALFRDLSRDPIAAPDPGRVPSPSFSASGYLDAPELSDVFHALPIHRLTTWRARRTRFYDDWRPEPWSIYRASSWKRTFEDRWRESGFGFDTWRSDRRRRQFYESLDQDLRARFRGTFNETYQSALAVQYKQFLAPAYDLGWQDGRDYGLMVAYEWHWRLGYFEGVSQSFATTAENTFHRNYAIAYRDAYFAEFDRWQDQAVLEITDLFVTDGNEDGVFEPGEAFSVGFVLVNYGGREDAFTPALDGAGLHHAKAEPLRIRPRSRQRLGHGVWAELDAELPTKRDHGFILRLGAVDKPFTIRVTRPIQMTTEPRVLERDNLAGLARLELTIENISRKPIEDIEVFMDLERTPIARAEPGETVRCTFEIDSMPTLDMIGGRAAVDIEVTAAGTTQDAGSFTFPEVATDLDNPDLVTALIDLARQIEPDQVEVDYAYRLLVRRLTADWDAAIKARGNPYKRDRKRNAEETALGRLVAAYRAERDSFANKEVFGNMRAMLLNMAKDLPGWHPFLRKQFRRLAKQIG